MTRFRLACLSLVAVATTSTVAFAGAMAPPPPAGQQAVTVATVVVGKVVRLEKNEVTATPYPTTPQQVNYGVAVLEVGKAIKGAKGQTHLRVGFIKPRPVKPVEAGVPGRPVLPPRPRYAPQLVAGQEVLLFLSKHHKENFHIFGYGGIIVSNPRNKKGFDSQVTEAENALKIMANPVAALKAKKIEDRLEAASLLVGSYNAYPNTGGKVDRVPVDEEQSKLILQTLLEADWNAKPTGRFDWRRHPRSLVGQLRLNELGYQYPRGVRLTQQQRDAHMKDWLKENVGKIRLKKFQVATPEKD